MLWLLLNYLGVGVLVGIGAGVARMISPPRHRAMPSLWVEVAYYILGWPAPLAGWLQGRIHSAKPDRR